MKLELALTPKSLLETMAVTQGLVAQFNGIGSNEKTRHIKTLQAVIDALVEKRPVGNDGKHGDLHTDDCGCEDVI